MDLFKRWLVFLLVGAFILRVFVAIFSFSYRENTDVLRYKDWARIAFLYGPSKTYITDYLSFGTLANNQPPGSLYIISAAYLVNIQEVKLIYRLFGKNEQILAFINGPFLNFSLRLPSLFADLGIGALIYFIINRFNRKSKKFALIGAFFFLFNPLVLYNSAFWGQMDSLNNFFLLLAVFLFLKNKYLLSIISFFFSLYIKFSLLFFLPLLFFLIFKKKGWKTVIYFLLSFLILSVFTFPISNNPVFWLFRFYLTNGIGEMTNITSSAFNFWWVIFFPVIKSVSNNSLFEFSNTRLENSPLDSSLFLNLPLYSWAILIFFIFFIFAAYRFLKRDILKPENLFLLLSLTALIAFLFLPRMHSRYLYPLFPFFAIYIGLTGRKIKTYLLLSFLTCLNLYVSFHPFRIPLLNFNLINNYLFQWAIAFSALITGLCFYFSSLRIIKK